MKVRLVLEADIEDVPDKLIDELRQLIAENPALVAFNIASAEVKWSKDELQTNSWAQGSSESEGRS